MKREKMIRRIAAASAAAARLASGFVLLASLAAPGCARSVNDYLAEARSNAPAAVKEAVVAIGDILYRKESAGIPFDGADREAILYLKDVANADTIPINRAAAIAALGRLAKADAGDVFSSGLKDPFWLSKFEAARAMGLQPGEKFAEALRDLLGKETRPEVRLEIVRALGRIKGPVALRTLLEVFLNRSEGVKDPQVLAYVALREMTGLSYGFDEVRSWDKLYKSKFGGESGPPPAVSPPGLPAGAGGAAVGASGPPAGSAVEKRAGGPPPAPREGSGPETRAPEEGRSAR